LSAEYVFRLASICYHTCPRTASKAKRCITFLIPNLITKKNKILYQSD